MPDASIISILMINYITILYFTDIHCKRIPQCLVLAQLYKLTGVFDQDFGNKQKKEVASVILNIDFQNQHSTDTRPKFFPIMFKLVR